MKDDTKFYLVLLTFSFLGVVLYLSSRSKQTQPGISGVTTDDVLRMIDAAKQTPTIPYTTLPNKSEYLTNTVNSEYLTKV